MSKRGTFTHKSAVVEAERAGWERHRERWVYVLTKSADNHRDPAVVTELRRLAQAMRDEAFDV